MASELVFTVDGAAATPARAISLAEAGLRERDDLQEWVLAHPRILGDDVMVVTFEFDRWTSGADGARERDRLDVLGLDADGRLVVAELKRDRAPDTVHMQAVKYAAMASRFTEEALLEHYTRFRARQGATLDEETARAELVTHAGELDPAQLRKPRIVLVAGAFPPTVTATVVWLTEMGLDVALQRVQAYRVFDDRTIVTVSRLFPVPDVEDFTVSPQRAEAQATEDRRKQGREKSTVLRLVAKRTIPDGTVLTLRPTAEVTSEVRDQIDAWVAEDPTRGTATWFNRAQNPLQWQHDGTTARPTPLVNRILLEAADVTRSVRGPAWWVLPDGRDLPTAAGPTRSGGAFDWSGMHTVMASIPSGRWTTYGDLAKLIGTAAQPVGTHIAGCEQCPNAQRVLGSDGRISAGFAWTDPDMPPPEELLRREGVRIDAGVADHSRRLSMAELETLLAGSGAED